MALGIGCDGNFKIFDLANAAHKVRGVLIALRMGFEALANAAGRITAQGQNMADAGVPVIAHDGVHLLLGGADAGEVGYGLEAGFFADFLEGQQGAVAGGAASAIGDRYEFWIDRFQPLEGGPECVFGVARLRRKKFE